MTAEWLTAYSTLATLIVIAATAVAAVVQLRHARSGNQIAALNEFRERLESKEFRDAEHFVAWELPKHYDDPAKFAEIFQVPLPVDYRPIVVVANFFENMGLFVKYGVLDRKLTCDVWAYVVLRDWNALIPVITYLRRDTGNEALFENFEFLAALSSDFVKKHPTVYPKGAPRMPADTRLLDARDTLGAER